MMINVFEVSQIDSLVSFLLPDGEIHIWKIITSDCVSRLKELETFLSSEEISRVERFYFEKDKIRFVVAHAMLRKIIARYLNLTPQMIVFRNDTKGKPQLQKGFGKKKFSFNISYSYDLIIFAFSRYLNLGVDVEFIRPIPDFHEIVNDYFHPEERTAFMKIPLCKRQKAFFDYWTRKEAFVKATGEGLYRALDSFSVAVNKKTENGLYKIKSEILRLGNDRMNPENWFFLSLRPATGYTGAVVFAR
jgi:4'-phosphopantetheinyl transferase